MPGKPVEGRLADVRGAGCTKKTKPDRRELYSHAIALTDLILNDKPPLAERGKQPMGGAFWHIKLLGDLAQLHSLGLVGDQLDYFHYAVDKIAKWHGDLK